MGARIASTDWAKTPLGPVEGWSQSLRTAVGLCITARAPMCLWWGPEYVLLYNDGYRPMLGAKHPWALGRSGLEVWAEAGAVVRPQLDAVRSGGLATWDVDAHFALERNGYVEETYFTYGFSPIRDESGAVSGICNIGTETTDSILGARRLRTLVALNGLAGTAEHVAQQTLEALAGNPQDVPFALVYLVEADGRGALLAGATGLPEGHVLAPARVLSSDAPGSVWPLADVVKGGQPAEVELASRGVDVTAGPWPEPVRCALVLPLASLEGTPPPGLLMVGVSPRRRLDAAYRDFLGLVAGHVGRALEAARAQEERSRLLKEAEAQHALFNAVLHQMPSSVIVAEPSGKLVLANQQQSEALHFPLFPAVTLENYTQYKGFHLDGRPYRAEEWPLARSLTSGEVVVGEELLLKRGDGTLGTVSVSSAPVRDEEGRLVAGVAITQDVTERRRAEEELKQRIEFEQQLIGIVSHDLRNPISAVMLGAQSLLRREGLDERALKSVVRIQSSAERALRMVRDLLDFTQARLGGGILLRPERLELHGLVRQVLEEVQMSHPERTILLHHEGNAVGYWDSDRLAQVLTNLATNAVKYSPEGTPVTVTTRGEDGWVSLAVHNQGPPIPPGVRGRLFQPLVRGTTDVDPSGRSVGLGLYIVKHLVDAHGGTIEVTSDAGEGTTFTVRLPRGQRSSG